jgi:hypothetical protein
VSNPVCYWSTTYQDNAPATVTTKCNDYAYNDTSTYIESVSTANTTIGFTVIWDLLSSVTVAQCRLTYEAQGTVITYIGVQGSNDESTWTTVCSDSATQSQGALVWVSKNFTSLSSTFRFWRVTFQCTPINTSISAPVAEMSYGEEVVFNEDGVEMMGTMPVTLNTSSAAVSDFRLYNSSGVDLTQPSGGSSVGASSITGMATMTGLSQLIW